MFPREIRGPPNVSRRKPVMLSTGFHYINIGYINRFLLQELRPRRVFGPKPASTTQVSAGAVLLKVYCRAQGFKPKFASWTRLSGVRTCVVYPRNLVFQKCVPGSPVCSHIVFIMLDDQHHA